MLENERWIWLAERAWWSNKSEETVDGIEGVDNECKVRSMPDGWKGNEESGRLGKVIKYARREFRDLQNWHRKCYYCPSRYPESVCLAGHDTEKETQKGANWIFKPMAVISIISPRPPFQHENDRHILTSPLNVLRGWDHQPWSRWWSYKCFRK